MKGHFSDLGIGEKLSTFNDGLSAIQHVETVLSGIQDPDVVHEQPITLLILDMQMPLMNGFETLKFVKEAYAKHNLLLMSRQLVNRPQRLHVVRPMICFFS